MRRERLFEAYITEHLDRAYRFAYTYTKNDADAQDVVSESIEKALRSLPRLKDTEKLHSWFFSIVSHTALDHLRQRKVVPLFEWDRSAYANDDYSHIHCADMLGKLEEKYRAVIVLRFFENFRLREIAEILGVNENTVKTRLYKALELLRLDQKEAGL